MVPAFLDSDWKVRQSITRGDTDFIPEMLELGRVALSLLPVGGTYTMDSGEAVDAAIALNPRVVIPVHRFDADLQMFADALKTNSDI